MTVGPTLRPMNEADIDAILTIENLSHPFPWSRGNFIDSRSAGYWCPVLADDAALCGYAILMRILDEAHLLNITVAPNHQGRGLGRRFMKLIAERLIADDVSQLLLEVRPSNMRALHLYAACGFVEIGRRRDYYPAIDGREDAIVMRMGLGSDA